MGAILRKMFNVFCLVCVGEIFAIAISITLFSEQKTFMVIELWRILSVGLYSALGCLLFYFRKEPAPFQMLLREIIYFCYILILLIFLGLRWEWLPKDNLIQAAAFICLVIAVYIFVMLVAYREDKKIAQQLNAQLKERRRLKKG